MDPNAGCFLTAFAGYRMMGQKHNEEITEEVEITSREMSVKYSRGKYGGNSCL
jgi:hypothetical protein